MTYILDIEQNLGGSTFSMHDDQKSLNYNLKIINYNLNPDENASRQQVGRSYLYFQREPVILINPASFSSFPAAARQHQHNTL